MCGSVGGGPDSSAGLYLMFHCLPLNLKDFAIIC